MNGELTRPPPSFAIAGDGTLYAATGIGPMKAWNGYASAIRDAGVPAPPTLIVVGSSTAGTITGALYGYQRWLDADGRVSNVSPISAVHEPSSSTKTITGATNTTPIVITATSHGFSTGNTVRIEGVLGNYSANGTWVVTNLTANTFSLDGSEGVADYTAGGSALKGVGQIDYSSVDAPTDSRVTRRQILRNKDGNTTVFYIDVDSTDLSATTFSSTNTDDQLGDAVVMVDSADFDINLESHSEPLAHKRYIASHYSRLWAAGAVEYKEGACVVTNGSATVTGIGPTNWTSSMVGWEFYPRGTSNTKSYVVASVDTPTQLTLSAVYTGTTDKFAYYSLMSGDEERRTIYFSQVGQWESFDLNRAVTLPYDGDSGTITGLFVFKNQLYVAFEHKMVRLTYQNEPDIDGFPYPASDRGCANHRCCVVTDDEMFLLDRKGFWVFRGNQQEAIGARIQPLIESDEAPRINWQNTEFFHAAHDPMRETVKWFVALEGHFYPQHAVCYQYRTERWWIEEYAVPITSSCTGELNGRPQLYLGTQSGYVLAASQGTLDGVRPENGTVRGTATSATTHVITDSTASFSANLVGFPVAIVSGRGAGQVRIISEVTSTTLRVVVPYTEQPDSTSVYQCGGFFANYRTGRFLYAQTAKDEKRGLAISWKPTLEDLWCCFRIREDRNETPNNAAVTKSTSHGDGIGSTAGEPEYQIDPTTESGYAWKGEDGTLEFRMDGPRYVQVELEAVPNEERLKVSALTIQGVRG